MAIVGMIGLTHPHSAMHLRTLGAMDLITGVVLCDSDPAARERIAAAFPKTIGVASDLAEVLARSDVSVVLLTLPNVVTPMAIVQAAAAGKHIICEKPGARRASELQLAIEAVRAHDVKFAACYLWRTHPASLKIRELIQEGAIGRVISAELRMVTTQVAVRDPSIWLFKRDVAGGGIATWLGGHWLDLLRFVTGEEIAEVSALVGTVGGAPIDVEDVASAALRLSGGGVASFYAGYLLAHGRPGDEGGDYDRAFIVRGTAGNVGFGDDDGEPTVVLERAGRTASETREVFRFALPPSPAYGGKPGEEFVEQLIDAGRTGVGEGPAPIGEALRVLEILDALYESAASGRTMTVRRTVEN